VPFSCPVIKKKVRICGSKTSPGGISRRIPTLNGTILKPLSLLVLQPTQILVLTLLLEAFLITKESETSHKMIML